VNYVKTIYSNASAAPSTVTGTFSPSTSGAPSEIQVFCNYVAIFNITTTRNPAGEFGGPVNFLCASAFRGVPRASNVVPPNNSTASGSFTLVTATDAGLNVIAMTSNHSILPTSISLIAANGSVLNQFCNSNSSCASPYQSTSIGSANLVFTTAPVVASICAGTTSALYVTPSYPNGEMRTVFNASTQWPWSFPTGSTCFPTYYVRGPFMLTGGQVIPAASTPAVGYGYISFYPSHGRVVVISVVHNLNTSLVGSHIHGPASPLNTSNVGIMTFLTFPNLYQVTHIGQSLNQYTLAVSDLDNICCNRTYFQLHTSTFPGGEIRGNIFVDCAPFWTCGVSNATSPSSGTTSSTPTTTATTTLATSTATTTSVPTTASTNPTTTTPVPTSTRLESSPLSATAPLLVALVVVMFYH